MGMLKNSTHFIQQYARRSVEVRCDDMSNAQIRKELFRLCEEFIIDNEITCPESVYQVDAVMGNAYEFIEEICNIIGYASIEDLNGYEDEDAGL